MQTDYNIKGIFIQPVMGNKIFEGRIKHNQKEGSIEGKLIDYWGNSSIKGYLNFKEGFMNFKKEYLDGGSKGYLIDYVFMKESSWLWEGTFEGTHTLIGGAECEIYTGEESSMNWDFRCQTARLNEEVQEEWTNSLIKRMEDKGIINITKDHSTGEDFIILRE